MRRSDAGWVILFMLVYFVLGQLLYVLLGFWGFMVWTALGVLFGYIMARIVLRRLRQDQIEYWRETHPDLGDEWLPEHLKDRA